MVWRPRARMRAKDQRGRGQRNLFPTEALKNVNNLLKPNNIQLIDKRLGAICGLGLVAHCLGFGRALQRWSLSLFQLLKIYNKFVYFGRRAPLFGVLNILRRSSCIRFRVFEFSMEHKKDSGCRLTIVAQVPPQSANAVVARTVSGGCRERPTNELGVEQ